MALRETLGRLWQGAAGIDWWETGLAVLWALVKIAGVVLLARLLTGFASRLIDRLAEREGRHREFLGDERRFRTIGGIVKSVVRYVVYFFAGVTILSMLGIDTSSILVGAGVVGLAVGFGAQNLVRDVISGFFILFEDQFAVGDYIAAGGVDGIVEEMSLRTTRLRAFAGDLHIIPNGVIDKVTNYSRGAMRVLFEVEVAYEEETSKVIRHVQEILDRFAAESEVVVEGPRVLGVSQLGASGVSIMVWAKVKPMAQWAVERELKLRIKESFDRAGIEIPYPRRVYIYGGNLKDQGPPPAPFGASPPGEADGGDRGEGR